MVPTRLIRAALPLGASLLLAGCISFGAKPPPSLFTLTPAATVAPGTTISGDVANALMVVEPEAPQKLAVTRVPVQVSATDIAYLKDAAWVDRPTRLFRRLLGETIRAKTGQLVLDSDDAALTPKNQLRGTLRDFGYDAGQMAVVVTYDAVRDVNGSNVRTRRFTASVPAAEASAELIGPALNQAANQVAGEVADWVG